MLPFVEIFGEKIFFYPLILGIIWGLAYKLFKYFVEKGEIYFPQLRLFFLLEFLVTWFGAKVTFVLSSSKEVDPRLIQNTNFWLGGGLVFYGGFLFGLLFLVGYQKYFKISFKGMEFIPIILALGHGVGRIGCFLAGCCYGTHCDLPWAIHLHGDLRHPVQLYESFSLILLSGILFILYKNKKSELIMSTYILSYAFLRFTLEFFRGDSIRGGYGIFSTSQWIAIIIFIAATFNCILKFRKIRIK